MRYTSRLFILLRMAGVLSTSIAFAHPFPYDLAIKNVPGTKASDRITLCCHGYGGNNSIAQTVASYNVVPGTLIGFNFPDHDISPTHDPHDASKTIGTIDQVLPLVYMIKYLVCDLSHQSLDVYGFSAGGGVIINALAAITQSIHDDRLLALGITQEDKQHMYRALMQGFIILDCPLKSTEEILTHEDTPYIRQQARQYRENHMVPIETLCTLHIALSVLLNFQHGDPVLTNRDDAIYSERLKEANTHGTLSTTLGSVAEHPGYHKELWAEYQQKIPSFSSRSFCSLS